MRTLFTTAFLICLAALLGCTNEAALGARMPEPIERRVPLPDYTDEEQRRYDEVQAYLVEQYKDYLIVQTTQTYIGDIIDWVDPQSVPGSAEEPPGAIPPNELQFPDAQLQVNELEFYPELQGPTGTIPMTRPTFEPYIRGWSDAPTLEAFLQDQEGGQPDGQYRLYAGVTATVDNSGGAGAFNQFACEVEKGTFSLMELAVSCDGPDKANTLEQVGVVASRDRKNFGDSFVRLQVEFFSEGLNIKDFKGGWHGLHQGFIHYEKALYGPGIALMPLSTPNGTQYYSVFRIQRSAKGDWWIAHNGYWLGYYPSKYFDLINSKACDISWYGEVFDKTPADWTATDMGSGEFADKGIAYASHIRNMTYYDPISGLATVPSNMGSMGLADIACYTKSEILLDALGAPHFFLGGPGGDAPGCN